MKVKMFTVYDSKAEAYGNPWFARQTGEAIRSFSDETNSGKENSSIGQHPEDYTLFELGEFDSDTGTFVILEAKKSLGLAADFKRSKMKAV